MSKNLEIAIKIFADSEQAMDAISKMETGVVGLAKNLTKQIQHFRRGYGSQKPRTRIFDKHRNKKESSER